MELEELKERVRQIVAGFFNVDPVEINEETRFAEDLGADSLDGVELVMTIEDEFDIEIPEEEAAEMKRFGDIVKYLQAQPQLI